MFALLKAKINMYKNAIVSVIVVMALAGVYFKGRHDVNVEWKLEKAEIAAENAKKKAAAGVVTTKIITEYVDRVKVVKQKGDTVTIYVTKWLTPESDSKCMVPNNFVSLHNAAASNGVAVESDNNDSKIKLSDVAKTVTTNYTSYYEVKEQLTSLQKWIREQQKVYK